MTLMKSSANYLIRGTLLALGLCAIGPVHAQANSGPVTVRVDRPLRPLERPLTDDGTAEPFLKPPVEYSGKTEKTVTATKLNKATPLRRLSIEPTVGSRLTFKSVPGGVVFGMAARFTDALSNDEWRGSRVEQLESGWQLRSRTGLTLLLPEDSASFMGAALAFSTSRDAGDWLVDIAGDGSIHLSYPLENTEAGMVLARADLAPQLCLPIFAGGKSLIVDRDVRLRADGERLRFEADLEVRFYRPERNPGGEELAGRVGTVALDASHSPATGKLQLSAPEGPQVQRMASYLKRASELAGWIGFFRWANSAEVEGLDEFANVARKQAHPVLTPRKIDRAETATWVTGGAIRPPAVIPDWMKDHRERVLED